MVVVPGGGGGGRRSSWGGFGARIVQRGTPKFAILSLYKELLSMRTM